MSSDSDTKDGLTWIVFAICFVGFLASFDADKRFELEKVRVCLEHDITLVELEGLLEAANEMDDESIAAGGAE